MADAHLAYRRSKFATKLPTDRVFTEGHFWVAPVAGGRQRVGFTKFATRMLGEVVEWEFEVAVGASIEAGQVIGWVEGFKAVSELYAPLGGRFAGANPELETVVGEIHEAPYDRGWLYEVEAAAPDRCLDAAGYAGFLDRTIDRMMGRDA